MYLRHFVTASQKNWLDLMDIAQFAYNLQHSSSTEKSPFEMVLGMQPGTPNEVAIQKTGSDCPAAYRYAWEDMNMALSLATPKILSVLGMNIVRP